MNRSARKLTLFHSAPDYDAFVAVLAQAQACVPMRLLCFVVMPNHWHLVLWPSSDADLSRYMRWVTVTHAIRWQLARGSAGTGAVYQGRFKAIPVQSDAHFLKVCRYVEQNPVRAGLTTTPEDWPWSSAAQLGREQWPTMASWPVPRPSAWHPACSDGCARDNDRIRECMRRRVPFGATEWQVATGHALGWSLRRRGRPPRLDRRN